jgi:acetyl-CoA carboxylase beta subunit
MGRWYGTFLWKTKMEVADIKGTFAVDPESSLIENCLLKCPDCRKWTSHKDWVECTVYCKTCYEHTAIECPNCGVRFDHVWSPVFKCKTK